MLRDLTIKNYRCFEDFQIDGLEQVNLFVGNNNSGKTSLLEAIYLLVNPNKFLALIEILLFRGEIIKNIYDPNNYRINSFNLTQIESIKHIFHKHRITSGYIIEVFSSDGIKTTAEIVNISMGLGLIIISSFPGEENPVRSSEFFNLNINHELDLKKFNSSKNKDYNNRHVYISAKKEELNILAELWNNIFLTGKETKVVELLKILEPKIERIGFIQEDFYHTVRLKLSGYSEPIPLSSMGAGMYRILTLAIALVTAENHVLLIDEIETGLHYEAQTDMWRLILATAKELNVQVFATTHSWDCIAAYQEALSQVEDQSMGKLFRLDSKYGKLRAVEYDAEDLDIAVRKGIEVR
jgi:AAA15 family ATPase/GTPase